MLREREREIHLLCLFFFQVGFILELSGVCFFNERETRAKHKAKGCAKGEGLSHLRGEQKDTLRGLKRDETCFTLLLMEMQPTPQRSNVIHNERRIVWKWEKKKKTDNTFANYVLCIYVETRGETKTKTFENCLWNPKNNK